jgi:very-short-patch-repair endonuclease
VPTYSASGEQPVPAEDADPLTWLLFGQDQVISRRQALRFLTSKAVRARLSSRRWRSAAAGVYLTHTGPATRQQQRWIAVLATGPVRPAVLAGLSALESHGLRGHRSEPIHVLIPAGSRDRDVPPGVVVHRTTRLPGADVHRSHPPRTMPARSLVDAAQWAASDDQARAIVAAGFQQRLVDLGELTEVLDRMPRAHRRALTREIATDATGGAHSLPEGAFLRLCRRGGLPRPARQVRRRDATGRWRYLDVYFEAWGVHVEIDGGQHMEVRQWWQDMRRQNELWVPGDRVLRFPSWAVRHRPGEVIAQLRAALIAAGWRPRLPAAGDLGRRWPL